MGKFEKGHKLAKGRPRGSLNRTTEQAKLTIQRAVNGVLDTMGKDLEEIKKRDPIRAMELAIKLLEFSIPKLKSIDMNATMEIDQRIQQITVNINKSGSDGDNH
jgi:hypothetical protein